MTSELKGQATERFATLWRPALRERAQNHPMIMFGLVTLAAFGWALIPSKATISLAAAPAKIIHQSSTTKTSRLPIVKLGGACKGQNWGGESVACLKMIARDNGRTDLKIRLIADMAPASPSTPNIF